MTKKLYYGFGSLVLVGIIAWVAFSKNPTVYHPASSTVPLITPTTAVAFGDFSTGSIQGKMSTPTTDSATGAGGTAGLAIRPTIAGSGTIFRYAGQLPDLPNLPVLRRDPVIDRTAFVASLEQTMGAIIHLKQFTDLRGQMVTLTERTADGYTVTIDFTRGSVSLYKQAAATDLKMLSATAGGTNAPAAKAITDDQVISVARQFLGDHGVSLDHTLTPVVTDLGGPIAAVPETTKAVPVVSYAKMVTFPWTINDTPVIDQSGAPYGLTVTVQTSDSTVTAVENIVDWHFTGSDYPLVSDTAKVLDVAKRGGLYGSLPTTVTDTIDLATPSMAYMISSYQLASDGLDYFIPAWRFGIGHVPTGVQLYQNAVVVPLVETLLTPPSDTTGSTPIDTAPAPSSGSGTSTSTASPQ